MSRIGLLITIVLGCVLFSPQQAKAVFSAPVEECGQGGLSGISGSSFNCVSSGGTCAPINSLITVIASAYQSAGLAPLTVTNANAYTWQTDVDTNTAANNYRTFVIRTVATGSACDTFTLTFGNTVSLAWYRVFHATGNSPTVPLDVIVSPLVSSTPANPQVSPNITTTQTGDLLYAIVTCAAGSNGWSTPSGYTLLFTSSFNASHADYQISGAAGSYNVSYPNSQSCVIGVSVINLVLIAYKTGATTPKYRNHSAIIRHKFPWDYRRRKLEIVRI